MKLIMHGVNVIAAGDIQDDPQGWMCGGTLFPSNVGFAVVEMNIADGVDPVGGTIADGVLTPLPPKQPPILDQILALEATVTNRRIREAALTQEGKDWLADVDAQIAALRAQL